MELLMHGGEHHEIGDGGWLMMTMTTDSPLRSPERTPDQPSREVTHHRPASLQWNYSHTAVSIMKLVMEDG